MTKQPESATANQDRPAVIELATPQSLAEAVVFLQDSGLLTPEAEEREGVLRSLVSDLHAILRGAKTPPY